MEFKDEVFKNNTDNIVWFWTSDEKAKVTLDGNTVMDFVINPVPSAGPDRLISLPAEAKKTLFSIASDALKRKPAEPNEDGVLERIITSKELKQNLVPYVRRSQ